MNLTLNGKTILITGGLGAIAEAVVKTLAANGATLVITDRVPEAEARPVLKAWGLGDATYFRLDVTDGAEVDRVVDAAFARHPDINIALGHAGGTGIFPFATCEPDRFDQLVKFNFLGQTYFARAVLRHWMQLGRAGHLIFTTSWVARVPMAGISAYVASKAGLEMFAKNLALEYADARIRVNCISPGNVSAGSSKVVYDTDPVYHAWVDRVSPLGAPNTSQSIANAFVYLCSSLADEVDGIVLQVDAGVGLPKLG